MAAPTKFPTLYQETIATVRARIDADAVASTDRPYDVREGTFHHDVAQTNALEMVRMWDAIGSEVPAVAFVIFAWGQYLDAHAAVFQMERKDAVQATGQVRLNGLPGTVVGLDSEVQTDATDAGDAVEFETLAAVTLTGGVQRPAAPALAASAGGALPAATYTYRVTALSAYGETAASPDASISVAANTKVTVTWTAVASAVGYAVYRDGYRVYVGGAVSYVDTNANLSIASAPGTDQSAGAIVAVQALDAGTDGNVGAGAITTFASPVPGVATVTNLAATVGGSERETDDALRGRILERYRGGGGGNKADYIRWALEIDGVGRVYVARAAYGPDTVQVVVMDANGSPVASTVVTATQLYLDPPGAGGNGLGRAPINHAVTVETPSIYSIAVAAQLTFLPGYSLDGANGTQALRADIVDALNDYFGTLDVGDDVIYEHVQAQFFTVPGVYNIANVTIGGGTQDMVVGQTPAQVARMAANPALSA